MSKKEHLTAKRKEFAEIVAETGDVRGAALKVYGVKYPSSALKKGEEEVSKEVVVRKIIRIWDKLGLTLDFAARKHLEIMRSPKTKKGDVLKAVDLVYKGHGVYKEADQDKTPDQNFLMLFVKQRKERGLAIPKNIIDLVKEESVAKGEKNV